MNGPCSDCEKVASFDIDKHLETVDKLMVKTMLDLKTTIGFDTK